MRRPWILLPAALLVGCGGGGSNSDQTQQGDGIVETIQISETEYSLNPSTFTLKQAGTYAFEVTNDGQITHALEIEEGDGGSEEKTGDISPGEKETLRFTFSGDGTYEMYCPIDGHKDQGMKGQIMVGNVAAPGGTTGQTTTDEDERPGY